MVGLEDELLEDGSTKWRKAKTFPLLVNARRHGNQVWGGTQWAWMVIIICLASAGLLLIRNGNYAIGLVVALITATLAVRILINAYKKTKPHG